MKNLLNNPQIIYLKGNHEDLFVKAAKEILNYYNNSSYIHSINNINMAKDIIREAEIVFNDNTSLHVFNGGESTLIDWLLDGASLKFIDDIDKLPICFKYNNIDFCHAGGGPSTFNEVYKDEQNNIKPKTHAIHFCIWDRECFNLGWTHNRICVHGHTPTVYLPINIYAKSVKGKGNIYPVVWRNTTSNKYDGWKIDMDTGATFTGFAYILNVLTLQVIGFKDEDLNHIEKEKHFIDDYGSYTLIT